jgi:NitT/TauT family transport system substrate-binding protein
MERKRVIGRVRGSLLLAGIFLGLVGTGAAGAAEKVSLRLKWLPQAQFAGYYVAQAKGYYAAEGLEVTINPGGPNIVAENLVASGSEQFAQGGGADSLLAGRDKGLPLVGLAVLFQKTPNMLVAKRESGITKLEDLAGKKVSLWYTGMQFIFRGMLRAKGVDLAKVTEVPQGVTMSPFINNEIPVASVTVYNELQTLYEQGIKDLVIFDPADYGVIIPRDTIVTSERLVQEKPELVQKFLRASLRGWKAAIENQAEAVELVVKANPNLKRDHQTSMMREVAKLMTWGPGGEKGIGVFDRKAMEFTHAFLLEHKQLGKPVDLDKAYTLKFWNDVPDSIKRVR